ncbi:MAG: hypothetical protein JSS14_22210 [Proteobacteria bacterium]|nr:hypothetical protein [Pseudomonadota bacterium]
MTALEDPLWTGLSQQRRDKLLEEYRGVNVEWGDWWGSTYEAAIEHLGEIGIDTDAERMFFSGFCSQGDGACFQGYVVDWALFLKHAGEEGLMLHRVIAGEFGMGNTAQFGSSRPRGHNVHEHSVSIGFHDYPDNPFDPDEDPLRYAAADVELQRMEELEKKFAELFRDQMRKLYRDLEKEYDYLTSDEQVVDYILNNCQDELVEDEEEETLDS